MKKTVLLLALACSAAFFTPSPEYPQSDPKDWDYRVVTDGKMFKLQYHWTPTYWGDTLTGRKYSTYQEARKAMVRAQIEAEQYAEDQKVTWSPVAAPAVPDKPLEFSSDWKDGVFWGALAMSRHGATNLMDAETIAIRLKLEARKRLIEHEQQLPK